VNLPGHLHYLRENHFYHVFKSASAFRIFQFPRHLLVLMLAVRGLKQLTLKVCFPLMLVLPRRRQVEIFNELGRTAEVILAR